MRRRNSLTSPGAELVGEIVIMIGGAVILNTIFDMVLRIGLQIMLLIGDKI